MKNIDIIRGFRTSGLEDLYPSNPLVDVVPGDIITLAGDKATLETQHHECGLAIEGNKNPGGEEKPSGKIPVYVSNFVVRYYEPAPNGVNVGDPVTVIDGRPAALTQNNTVVWGYVVGMTDTSFDVRVNY